MAVKITHLSDGTDGIFVKNDRFNTTLISFNFYLPLAKETVAEYALLPFILTTCGEYYPDFSALNYKLEKMYGAQLDASTEKYGDYQLLRITISVINDKYTLDNESLVKDASELVTSLIFNPSVKDNSFCETDLQREKRKAIEHIKSEISEKRTYAKNRLNEEMYKNMPYGIPKCGTVDDVNAITGESLYKAWQKMLSTAYIRVQIVGTSVPQKLFEDISEKFSQIERKNITDCKISEKTTPVNNPKTITEYMDVQQGKLVLGFSSEVAGDDDISMPLTVMTDIFGGGPYSRLFSNVREKMSLCYYCSASCIRSKGLITVDSGVETENESKAEKEIQNQLEIMKNGEFTDFEFNSSIKSTCDSLMAYYDSQISLDLWYALKANNQNLYSPEDISEKISKITREDIVKTAKGINLHTIYKLLPKEKK